MGFKWGFLLTLLSQPQELWAPHGGNGDVKEMKDDTEECSNMNIYRNHLQPGILSPSSMSPPTEICFLLRREYGLNETGQQ